MKNKKLKGFTLIELIVVLAIFSLIMFGAMQLIPHVSKIMVLADVREGGSAAVSSINNYLENQLSSAEYIIASNTVPADQGQALADEFVKSYYEGVVRAGSDANSTVQYASGQLHVMTIDNTQNGKISSYVYAFDCDLGATATRLPAMDREFAVNKAYYDTYSFNIRAGLYDNHTFDPTQPDTYEDLIGNLSTRETTFSILASTTRNGTVHSFVSNATMSLVNIYARGSKGVPGVYYVVHETWDDANAIKTAELADITNTTLSKSGSNVSPSGIPYTFDRSREYGAVLTGSKVMYDPASTAGYTFVYSYGSEIDTQ